jgi:hypothetical protein
MASHVAVIRLGVPNRESGPGSRIGMFVNAVGTSSSG